MDLLLHIQHIYKHFFAILLLTICGLTGFAQTVSINSSFTHALCMGTRVDVPYTVSGTFGASNDFNLELSDQTGNFSFPVVVATNPSTTTSGVLSWAVPTGMIPSSTYRLRITATSPAYTSAEDSISIYDAPNKAVGSSNTPVCHGDTLRLSAITDTLTTLAWSGPAGFTSTQLEPLIPNADTPMTGLYFVTASLFGCPAPADTFAVHIYRIDASVFIDLGPVDTICAGTSVTFTAIGHAGGPTPGYTWQKNNVTVSTGSSIYISSTLANNDTIKVLYASSMFCARPIVSTYKTLMVVKPIPPTSIASSNSPVCTTDPISLRASASTFGSTYSWTGPAGFTSALQNPTIPSADSFKAGAYIVRAILNGCASALDTDTVVVVPSVLPAVTLTASPSDVICKGQRLTLTANTTNGGTSPVFKWYLNSVLIPGATSSSYFNDTLADGYGITCSMSSSLTCPRPVTVTFSEVVTVKDTPTVSVAHSNSPLCSSDTIKLSATANPPGSSYSWTGPHSFSSTSQFPTIPHPDSSYTGNYVVHALLNGCTSSPYAVPVSVTNDIFTNVAISVSPGTVLFPGAQATFTAVATNPGSSPVYQWKKNGFDIPGANGSTLVYSNLRDDDSISVTMTSSLDCAVPRKALSNQVTMHVAGIVKLHNDVKITPNPTKGLFIVRGIDTTGTELNISVVNVVGKRIFAATTPVINGIFYQEINLSGEIDGVYFIHMKTDAEDKIERIVVHH